MTPFVAFGLFLESSYSPSAYTCALAPECPNIPSVSSSMQVTAVGAVSWIVDPEDANVLMPIGAIGELLIEGADQARGYLDNEVKTNAVFIRDPTWAIDHHQARRPSRLYKTGDLVRYKDDGTVNYLERKDTQVKHEERESNWGKLNTISGIRQMARTQQSYCLPMCHTKTLSRL